MAKPKKAKTLILESKEDSKKSIPLEDSKGENGTHPIEQVLAKVTDHQMKEYLINKLHDDSGACLMDCKKALVESGYDLDKAKSKIKGKDPIKIFK